MVDSLPVNRVFIAKSGGEVSLSFDRRQFDSAELKQIANAVSALCEDNILIERGDVGREYGKGKE